MDMQTTAKIKKKGSEHFLAFLS